MKRSLMLAVLIASLAQAPNTARSNISTPTAENWWDLCNLDRTACQAYLTGFYEGSNYAAFAFDHDPFAFVPGNVSHRQIFGIGYNWIKKHPEQRHNNFAQVLYTALSQHFLPIVKLSFFYHGARS
jgi:hypothetical protein